LAFKTHINKQESRAAARERHDVAAVLFGLSSATTFTASIMMKFVRHDRQYCTHTYIQYKRK